MAARGDRRRHRPPRLGFARPPDGRGRDRARGRRARAGHRAGRRLDGHGRGARPARRRRRAFGGLDVRDAVAAVNGEIAAALAGRDGGGPGGIDAALIALDGTPGKSRLGGNAIVATSMAVLHAAAAAAGLPLWRHLAGDGAGAPADARDPDLRRRRPCRPARRHPGLHGRRAPGRHLRRGARHHRRGLPRGRRRHGRAGQAPGRRGRGRLLAGLRQQRGGARHADAGDRARRLPAGRGCRRSRSTSPPPSSARAAATGSGSIGGSSTAAA